MAHIWRPQLSPPSPPPRMPYALTLPAPPPCAARNRPRRCGARCSRRRRSASWGGWGPRRWARACARSRSRWARVGFAAGQGPAASPCTVNPASFPHHAWCLPSPPPFAPPQVHKTCDTDKGAQSGRGGGRQLSSGSALSALPGTALSAVVCSQLARSNTATSPRFSLVPPRLPCAGGCNKSTPVTTRLQEAPRVFSLQIAWQSNHESPEDIGATLGALDETVELSEVRPGPASMARIRNTAVLGGAGACALYPSGLI